MAAIFDAASFSSLALPRPTIGSSTPFNPPNGSDPVVITLSDNSIVKVFDTVVTALKVMEFMRQRSQWMLQASDDVAVVSVSGTKLMICEMTLLNQKLLASFVPVYSGGQTRFVHRTMSQTLTLDKALQSVGFAKLSATDYHGNLDLTTGTVQPYIKFVDWNYQANPATSASGTLLDDPTPITYDFTPEAG